MPFTFSHPAIVLPLFGLLRNKLSLTGLVIGSLTPDFEYFIRMRSQSSISHTIRGLFLFDLPMGILLAFIFHLIVRDSLYNNFPSILKQRVVIYKSFDWIVYFRKHWFAVILSILIGAASHLFWDAFTHPRGFFVGQIPILSTPVHIAGRTFEFYRILQHVSTIFGAAVIGAVILKMPKHPVDSSGSLFKYWLIVSLLMLFIVILRLSFGVDENFLGQFAVTTISATLIALIITPFLIGNKLKTHGI